MFVSDTGSSPGCEEREWCILVPLIYDPDSLSLCSFSFSKRILQSLEKKQPTSHMTIERSF